MVATAHPDDEALGFGGVVARYANEGTETYLVTATHGDRGRYFGHAFGSAEHPGRAALSEIRDRELTAAAQVLGIREVVQLGYPDQELDRVAATGAVSAIVTEIRRARPQVVLTFAPDGAYGHPDHIAISQLTAAAIVAAADPRYVGDGRRDLDAPHTVSKFYYLAWNRETWAAYERAFKRLAATVDGVERQATPWPDWSITTAIDTHAWVDVVTSAVSCHQSQVAAYAALKTLDADGRAAIWGTQTFYRVFSLVNAGRQRESDLFEGVEA